MKRSAATTTGAALLLACVFAAQAQEKVSDGVVKIGMLEDMSSIYADITGVGAVTAAKIAVEDFGGKVLGKPIEVIAADHQNKPDILSATAREWFDTQHVDALLDVAASATALAAIELAKAKNKIVVLNGPGATRITNEACTPVSIHYTYDNYALSHGTGATIVKAGYDTWFFLTADYAFGHDLEAVTAAVVRTGGGKVLGSVRVPINTLDFSSALLQAQSSKAKVIALANAGADTTNSIKQAAEFGIVRGGQKMAGLLVFINDINTLGLEAAQGMLLTNAFYWDRNEESRAWAHRYFPAHEQDAEHDAGWDLFGHHALSQSRGGRRYGRDPAGDGEDALNTDQRLLRQERKDPRGRPDGARDVLVRGQEACGIQGGMGLLQACCHDPGGPGIPAVVGIQMPTGEEGAVGVRTIRPNVDEFLNAIRA
jgi:ABC-type branched-subunit amino acid transport system substrate-binding protein